MSEKTWGADKPELVKFLPATPRKMSQFIFDLNRVEAYLKSRGVDNIAAEKVLFIDVRNGEAKFVATTEELSALSEGERGDPSTKKEK